MAALLDVNALIALVDSEHVHHEAMQKWFLSREREGWATCPLTENGMVRVLSRSGYRSGARTPAEAIEVLIALKAAFSDSYHFWPDDVSISDDALLDFSMIASGRQVTDVYLMALAVRRGGVLASFDRSIAWQAVRGGSAGLVERPA